MCGIPYSACGIVYVLTEDVTMRKKCNLWQKSLENGYGRRKVRGHSVYAHRHAYEEAYGPIPKGIIVRHKCNVRACVEPTHLILGTHKQNAQDRVASGRQGDNRGVKNGNVVLSAKQVVRIRKEYARGKISQRALAKKSNVSLGCIFPIVTRKTWTHL